MPQLLAAAGGKAQRPRIGQSLTVEMVGNKADLPNAIALNSSMVNAARLKDAKLPTTGRASAAKSS